MEKQTIVNLLHDVEKDDGIEILYACEIGSRVWGFSNDESNHNVRFIFRQNSVRDYLALARKSDVLEYRADGLDIIGWDIKKALDFHYNDNCILRECLASDEVYIDRDVESLFSGLGGFNTEALKNNYYAMALVRWRQYAPLEFNKTKTKKYLHVIRIVLSWNLLDRDISPPININDMLSHEHISISEDTRKAIGDLISYHRGCGSLDEDTIFILNNFIMNSLNMMGNVKTKSVKDIMEYDERFRQIVMER
jgi:hypothetical protein